MTDDPQDTDENTPPKPDTLGAGHMWAAFNKAFSATAEDRARLASNRRAQERFEAEHTVYLEERQASIEAERARRRLVEASIKTSQTQKELYSKQLEVARVELALKEIELQAATN